MIDCGANPYVVGYTGQSNAEHMDLSNLKLPPSKSIFFSIEPFSCSCEDKDGLGLPIPWFYKNGVFDGQFDSVIGKGASGVVLHGYFQGEEAAYKFVEIPKDTYYSGEIEDALSELSRRLNEMRSLRSTNGSNIVDFYGHFR